MFPCCGFRRRRVNPSSTPWRNAPTGCTRRSSTMASVCRSTRTETASATSVAASNQCCLTKSVLSRTCTDSTDANVRAPGPWSYLLINVTMLIRMQCVQVCPGRISSLKVFSQREIQTFPTVIFQHLLSQHDAQRLKRAGINSSASCSLALWNCFGAHKTHFTTIIKKRMPSMAQVGKSHVALVRDVYTPYLSRLLMWKCSLCFLRHFKAWYLFLWCLRSTFSPLAWRLQTFCLEWPSCHCSPSAKWLIMQPQPL